MIIRVKLVLVQTKVLESCVCMIMHICHPVTKGHGVG